MGNSYRERKKIGKEAGISEEELAIFGLTDAEAKLLLALLELGPTQVSKLAREADMSHTTAHSALRRLSEQGLVRRVSKGYSSVWEVVQADKVREKLQKALAPFELGISKEQVEIETGAKVLETGDFFIFDGLEDMLKALQWFYLNHRGQEIGHMCPESAQNQFHMKLDESQKMALNQAILTNLVKIIEKDAHIEPRAGDSEVAVANDLVFVINWGKERITMIKNPDVRAFFSGICF